MSHYHEGRRQLPTSETARSVVGATASLTGTAVGHIAPADARFLLTLLETANPSHVLEIGVASGTSTLMLLRMLEKISPSTTLVSVDIASEYYADQSKPVGYFVTESYSTPPANWRLVTRVGAMDFAAHPDLQGSDQNRHYDFVFIDAHHGHPWPTLDALCVLPFSMPGSWIAFHDINLPLLGDWPYFGAVHMITDWPLDVLISEETPIPNTGAIRLSDAADNDAARLLAVLDRPWDCGLDLYHSTRIAAHLKTFLSAEQFEVVRTAFERNADREVK